MTPSIDIRVVLIGAAALLIALHVNPTDNAARLTGLFSSIGAETTRCAPPVRMLATGNAQGDVGGDITGSIADPWRQKPGLCR
jgi:hypothetical protein